VNRGTLPILGFVQVDPDTIRRRLPEFETYAQKSPTLVNDLTRKESAFLAELLLMAALQNGRNVVFDSAMRSADWFLKLIRHMKMECSQTTFGLVNFPRIAILHITAPTEVIFQRSQVSGENHKVKDDLMDDVPRKEKPFLNQVPFLFCDLQEKSTGNREGNR
jgi:hypothetical protein